MEQKYVVICDDNTTFLHLMKQLFERKGFHVRTARDGDEVLGLISSTRPDFLLLDLQMPATGGIAVLESLQSLEGKRPYTLVVSAYEGPEWSRRAASLGAQEFWMKPFNAFELTERLRTLAQPPPQQAPREALVGPAHAPD
jgi:CheY-like chemotaxis protein